MTPKKNAMHFFQNISDDLLAQLALYDWSSLELLCFALTLDVQEIIEKKKTQLKNS